MSGLQHQHHRALAVGLAKVRRTSSTAAALRWRCSASCAGVGAVRPVHGSRPSLLPTTCTAVIATPARVRVTFSGRPCLRCEVRPTCLPSAWPGRSKKTDRSAASRSSGS
jgi:hypothetical protein